MRFDVEPTIDSRELKAFFRIMLPPEIEENQINQITKAFISRFAPSDKLPSPFRKDLFLLAGANLIFYQQEGKGEQATYHFGFSDLDEPSSKMEFSLSASKDANILSSKSGFVAFLKLKMKELQEH